MSHKGAREITERVAARNDRKEREETLEERQLLRLEAARIVATASISRVNFSIRAFTLDVDALANYLETGKIPGVGGAA